MQQNGYRTALLGKWHASKASSKPVRGFDRWLSYDAIKAGWKNQYLHSGKVLFSSDGDPLEYTGVQARFITEEAIKFIDDKDSKKPFFININYVEPHFPFEGLPERLVSKYRVIARNIIRDGGNSELGAHSNYFIAPSNHEESLAQYLAAISLIDDQIGRLIDALEGRELLDNTIIAFVSDHGLLMGQYGLYGKTNASFPYNFYEETIRISFIIYGPKNYMRGKQTREEFVDLLDLHNTVLDFARDKNNNKGEGPGRSIRALLNGKRVNNWKRYQVSERSNARMITDGKWKLVRYFKKDGSVIDQWYDLTHPMKEYYISEPPRQSVSCKMISALDDFFLEYEIEEFSGRRIWELPKPNFNSQKFMESALWQ